MQLCSLKNFVHRFTLSADGNTVVIADASHAGYGFAGKLTLNYDDASLEIDDAQIMFVVPEDPAK